MRLVCLASGRGSNFEALVQCQQRDEMGPAQVVALGVNRPGCGAMERASRLSVPTFLEDHKQHESRQAFEEVLVQRVLAYQPDVVVLAGFMRVLTATFLDGVGVPVVNLHPALLPAFPGTRGIEDAFEAKVRLSGCTTHVVTEAVDGGPILMQGLVPLAADDSLADFQARMQRMEHRLLPATLRALAAGDLRVSGGLLDVRPGFETHLVDSPS